MDPGKVYSYRAIKYCYHKGFLKCLMPSGRIMHYYKPRVNDVMQTWGERKPTLTYMGLRVVDGKTTRQWTRIATYGPKLAQNATQGYCRDLLAHAMLRLEAAGYPVVWHVHDEATAELSEDRGSLEEFERIMTEVPTWAVGMPIRCDGWEGRRYRK
jgi:DNA polymerase